MVAVNTLVVSSKLQQAMFQFRGNLVRYCDVICRKNVIKLVEVLLDENKHGGNFHYCFTSSDLRENVQQSDWMM
jgi:hypothetical protein